MASSVTRFNLLLLEEGELFFEDYAAILYLPNNNGNKNNHNGNDNKNKKLSGRLKVASKNLIFEPHTISYPIIRFKYSFMESLHMDKSKQHLIVITSQIVCMKTHNVIKPYEFREISSPLSRNGIYIFEPSYSRLDDFVGLVAKIYQITKNKSKNKVLNYEQEISRIQSLRESKIPFDSSWFVDINEMCQLSQPLIVSKLTPLVELRGLLQITNKRIYFQPFHAQSSKPMLKYNLNGIKYIYKRRHIMLPRAIEITFNVSAISNSKLNDSNNNNNNISLLLSFEKEEIRDLIFKLLYKYSTNKTESLQHIQREWINGNISNFDYLMFLNEQSGRSFNDLTQYPIFPWIIIDYKSHTINLNNVNIYRDLSKPIGALNPIRLNKFLRRYKEMPTPKFMYGSHYSTPGYVMYFLVRQFPEYMLRFQNGKFDTPDRLFSSIERTWDSAYSSLTDVKELIPQFYDPKYYKFLLNNKNLNLGIRTDKKEVHNVILPPWANNSPKYFIEILRKALESKYVSNNLHQWIDLIFGYKQTGIESEKAYNKFYYLTYEGAVNIKLINDKSQLKSIQMQINEFGQTPSQLFKKSHPKKYSNIIPSSSIQKPIKLKPQMKPPPPVIEQKESLPLNNNSNTLPNNNYESLITISKKYNLYSISPHTHRITDICISENNKYLYSVSHDSTLSIYDFTNNKIINSRKISNLALSSCVETEINNQNNIIACGSWDNNIYLYNSHNNKIFQTLKSHSDAISCLNKSFGGINSGSWDNTIKIWKYNKYNNGIYNIPEITYKCNSEIRCIDSNNNSLILTGDENGNIYMFDTKVKKKIKHWNKGHKDEITSIKWINNTNKFVTSSSDSYIKYWNASNGKLIKEIKTNENINSIHTDGKLVISGGELGQIKLFDIGNENSKNINEIKNHCLIKLKINSRHSISKLCLTNNANIIVIGTKQYTNNIHIFKLNENNSKNNKYYYHKKTKSLPIASKTITTNNNNMQQQQTSNNKTYSFGSNAFAKLTQSASSLFSFGSNQQK